MNRKLLYAALIAFPMMSATAAPAVEKPLTEGKPYVEQRQRIMSDLQGGEIYSEISAENRGRVVEALGRIDRLLGNGEHTHIPDKDKIAVFNDQDLVNTLLTQAREDSRLICRRERPVGSNRPQNICITVAARRQAREDGTDVLRHLKPSQEPISN
ncbi:MULTISPECIES: hypothetical protein [Stenotrophomonas]|uniref:Secreted protein n=1 Tax=Stenotrophomonas nitritireducens TaxID=83617 RepID=A0ABR5NGG7_9GAMM|nr:MULTISPECIES: hypothetical protein [Stenotrophomonas]KRG54794.1 hypothetical protein ABB22_15665 [Stenotrophomonas nitritireducens]